MGRPIAEICLSYIMLKLSLLIVSVVTLLVTALVLPLVIQACIVLAFALYAGLICIVSDKSVTQKKE